MSRLNKKIYKAKKGICTCSPCPRKHQKPNSWKPPETHSSTSRPPPAPPRPRPLALDRMTASNSPERWLWWSPWWGGILSLCGTKLEVAWWEAVAEWAGSGYSQGSVTFQRHAAHAPKVRLARTISTGISRYCSTGVCASFMSLLSLLLFSVSCSTRVVLSLSQWDIFYYYVWWVWVVFLILPWHVSCARKQQHLLFGVGICWRKKNRERNNTQNVH